MKHNNIYIKTNIGADVNNKKASIRFITIKSIDDFQVVAGKNVTNVFPVHIHQKYCIGVIEKGNAQLVVKNKLISLNSSCAYLVNPGESHQIKPVDSEGFDHIVFCFGLQFCKSYFNTTNHENHAFKFNTFVINDSEIGRRLLNLFSMTEKKESFIKVEYILMDLLGDIHPFCSFTEPDAFTISISEGIYATSRYIKENCMKNLNLDELASFAHLSKYHFSRLFKNEIGISPYDFQIQARIKLAGDLLLNAMPIAEVAYMLGFADQSHFTRFFKRDTGISPAQFVKMNIRL